jgi:hypothetical protein
MAKPINATPTLKGECADRFAENLRKPPTAEKKQYLKDAKEVYKKIEANK